MLGARIFVPALIASAILASPGLAQGRGNGPAGGTGRGSGVAASAPQGGALFMFRWLNLTDAQKASLQAILDSHQASLAAKEVILQAAQKAVHDAMPLDSVSEADFKVLLLNADAARLPIQLERRLMLKAALAILTQEQRDLWLQNAADQVPGSGMGGGMAGRRPW